VLRIVCTLMGVANIPQLSGFFHMENSSAYTVTVTHPLFLFPLFFFSLFGLSFIVFCFMATFITLFCSFHLLVGLHASWCSHRLVKFGFGSASHRFPSSDFRCEISILSKMKFRGYFRRNWFSPSDFEDGRFVITPAVLPRQPPQTRFQLIDHVERFHLNGTRIFPLFQFFRS